MGLPLFAEPRQCLGQIPQPRKAKRAKENQRETPEQRKCAVRQKPRSLEAENGEGFLAVVLPGSRTSEKSSEGFSDSLVHLSPSPQEL